MLLKSIFSSQNEENVIFSVRLLLEYQSKILYDMILSNSPSYIKELRVDVKRQYVFVMLIFDFQCSNSTFYFSAPSGRVCCQRLLQTR